MVDEFRVIFDIIDNTGSGELDLLGVKRACGLLGQKRPSVAGEKLSAPRVKPWIFARRFASKLLGVLDDL
jgi:hypothetical protein